MISNRTNFPDPHDPQDGLERAPQSPERLSELTMRIVWVSPHCWPDYVLREDGLGKKSQGGQTVVMYQATIALAQAFPDLEVDIYARYEDGESVETHIHPRVRVIRLPLGPTDSYLPKEAFWGAPIEGFVDEVAKMTDMRKYLAAFAGCAYQKPKSICPQHQMKLPRIIKG